MSTRGDRNWGPVGLAAGLVVTFVVLLALGTQRPREHVAAPDQSPSPTAHWLRKLGPGEQPPQFVLFSFDGAGSHEHWQRLLHLNARTGAKFTAFLSGTYLLTDAQATQYTGPGHAPGKASIPFGGTPEEVRTRIGDLNTARDRGIEIGTHYNGHFCKGAEPSAGRWNSQQWKLELEQFFRYVNEAAVQGLRLDAAAVRGGRTPCLEGRFDQFAAALAERGMAYDSSQVTDGISWPHRRDGIWEFALPQVRMAAVGGRKVVLSDHHLWFALNRSKQDDSRRDEFAGATLEVYRAAYDAALRGNRAPLVIGNHFNDWAGGGFSEATRLFMAEVCTRPDAVCTTFSEVIRWMDLQDPATLEALRRAPAAQT